MPTHISVSRELLERLNKALSIAENYIWSHASSLDPENKTRTLDLASAGFGDWTDVTSVHGELLRLTKN